MNHDTDTASACSACDLGARLHGELLQARAAVRDLEQRFLAVAVAVAEGAQEVAPGTTRELKAARRRVTALEQVLSGVLGIHGLGECHVAGA